MTNSNPNKKDGEEQQDNVFSSMAHVGAQLEAMERFISRRFDEISMEINATSQQVDMAEEGIVKRFGEILEVLHAISYSGDGGSPANAGVELDAVVDMTEQAANKILDAADRIAGRIHQNDQWKNDEERKVALEGIDKDVEEIFMACSFQDITGQRIRKTLENLKLIEERLGNALNKMGIEIEADKSAQVAKASSQAEVDEIFGSGKK